MHSARRSVTLVAAQSDPGSGMTSESAPRPEALGPAARVQRHLPLDRAYHWLMAASALILMATAFLPILGWKFEWLPLHWMTGVLLVLLVAAHIGRALIWQDWHVMMIDTTDLRDAGRAVMRAVGGSGPSPGKPGKYSLLQKLYHLAIAVLMLSLVASGCCMLLKIDTPWWRRDPYWFTPETWGAIYAVHGFAGMALITMLIIHVYFAFRPDEWWLTQSMFSGFISRRDYMDRCDQNRWVLADERGSGDLGRAEET